MKKIYVKAANPVRPERCNPTGTGDKPYYTVCSHPKCTYQISVNLERTQCYYHEGINPFNK